MRVTSTFPGGNTTRELRIIFNVYSTPRTTTISNQRFIWGGTLRCKSSGKLGSKPASFSNTKVETSGNSIAKGYVTLVLYDYLLGIIKIVFSGDAKFSEENPSK